MTQVTYDSDGQILSQDSIVSLKCQLQAKGVIPFVGAGMSVPFGYPGWTNFLRQETPPQSMDRIQVLLEQGSYEEVAELLSTTFSFRERIKTVFGVPPRRLTERCPIEFLPTLFPSGPVFTTNFDRVLEEVYARHGKPLTGPRSSIHQTLEFREHTLIKLHGDFADDESRVLTLKDYVRHYGDIDNDCDLSERVLPRSLCQLFTTESVLFLGCGLRNDRYLRIMRKMAPRTTHYALIAYDPTEDRGALFQACNIRPIFYAPIDGHRLIADIFLFLLGRAKIRQDSTLELDVRPDEDLLQVVKRRLEIPTVGVPAFDETAFSSALRFRNDVGAAQLKIVLQEKMLLLQSNPRLRIPFTMYSRSPVDLRNPADEILKYEFLHNTREPLSLTIEPDSPCAIVLHDSKSGFSVRAKVVF